VQKQVTAPLQAAENLAINALAYIAGEPEVLNRFLALTGLESTDIRKAAAEPGFLAGVLDFLMDHESILLTYATLTDQSPNDFVRARSVLSGSS
jgi:hypothetical protein